MEPRNRLRQAGNRFLGSLKGLQIRALQQSPPRYMGVPSLCDKRRHLLFQRRAHWSSTERCWWQTWGTALPSLEKLKDYICYFSDVSTDQARRAAGGEPGGQPCRRQRRWHCQAAHSGTGVGTNKYFKVFRKSSSKIWINGLLSPKLTSVAEILNCCKNFEKI